jgi:low affinity Fe/Cu permease
VGRVTDDAPWDEGAMDRQLFNVADFLSRPPGFYLVMTVLVVCTILVPLGWTEVVTYVLSVAAIIITGVVLIQGYRDTAAIHAKLDELVLALNESRNDVVGLEHENPDRIKQHVEKIEREALEASNTLPRRRHRQSVKGRRR